MRKSSVYIALSVLLVLVVSCILLALFQLPRLPTGKIETAVRASFPHFCVVSNLIVKTDPAPRVIVTVTPDIYYVGCESTWNMYGPAFTLNVRTCQILITSLTLDSELSPASMKGDKMPVCPDQP